MLLIIFMVIAPQLEAGERVELPGIANIDKTSKLESYTLTVTAGGRLIFEKQPTAEADLERALADAHARAPEKRMVLKANRGVRYGRMRELFAGDDEAQIAVQEVVVVAAPDTTTEAVQIVRRQKAATVSDAISAEQISRTPDGSRGARGGAAHRRVRAARGRRERAAGGAALRAR